MTGTLLCNERYEVLERIGDGGAAVVYRARDHSLNRDVAVKVLRDELAQDHEFVERFPEQRSALIDCLVGDVVEKDMSGFLAALAELTPVPGPV